MNNKMTTEKFKSMLAEILVTVGGESVGDILRVLNFVKLIIASGIPKEARKDFFSDSFLTEEYLDENIEAINGIREKVGFEINTLDKR